VSRTYFLTTSRLGFSTWSGADLSLAVALWTDPAATGLIGGPFSTAYCRDRLAREQATQASAGIQYWPVFRLEDGDFAGCAGLRPHPSHATELEMGIHLRPLYQSRGFGQEAAEAIHRYGFEVLHTPAILVRHHPQNAASARLVQSLGYRYTHDELYEPTGLQHPAYRLDNPLRS